MKVKNVLCNIIFASVVASAGTSAAIAGQIDLSGVKLPWKNAESQGAMYNFIEKPNTVFVFEAYSLGCHWCNVNAPQVKEMAQSYQQNIRVQFVDLGLDTREIDYTRWIAAHKPTYPVVQDLNRKVFDAFKQSNSIPQTFVVDCEGKMVGGTVGSWGEAEKELIRSSIAKAQDTICDN